MIDSESKVKPRDKRNESVVKYYKIDDKSAIKQFLYNNCIDGMNLS